MIAVTEKRERGREKKITVIDGWKRFRAQISVSAAHSSESKSFRYKNVWKVAKILFLVTIVNAILHDIKITNLGSK